jgi:hypothetical protein
MTMPEWVKVDFYGLVDDADTIAHLDMTVLAEALARAFGFTHIDHLSAKRVDRALNVEMGGDDRG